MKFRWDQRVPPEWQHPKPPPVWVYLVLFLVIEGVCLAYTVMTWPAGKPVGSPEFTRSALAVPFTFWLTICAALYSSFYDGLAFEAAVRNAARWHMLVRWQRLSRAGMAVLDSVILTPEADLAERMLKLEGSPPENPGKVMLLGGLDATHVASRVSSLLETLLTPLAARLAEASRSNSFEIVMQCDRQEWSTDVKAVWERLKLPGRPRVRWIDNDRNVNFAENWFTGKSDSPFASSHYAVDGTPKYRLVVAWHLNDDAPGIAPATSEAAVALLLGSRALVQEKPELKRQAWLLRQVVGEADQVDRSLALLLNAAQAPRERIRHFWHSRLKGLAQHATLGAVRDADLKIEAHALDPAIGPQAPVARWVLQALAGKMALYGQGAQLVALPHEEGVALNLVVKELPSVDAPWKTDYEYNLFAAVELVGCVAMWVFGMLLSPDNAWGTFETVFTSVMVVVVILCGVWRILAQRVYADDVWRQYG